MNICKRYKFDIKSHISYTTRDYNVNINQSSKYYIRLSVRTVMIVTSYQIPICPVDGDVGNKTKLIEKRTKYKQKKSKKIQTLDNSV